MNWKQAMTLGLLAPGVWEGERVPVAYSYNGVVLPGLPETGKPYAVIVYLYTRYVLFCSDYEFMAKRRLGSSGQIVSISVCPSTLSTPLRYELQDGVWTETTASEVGPTDGGFTAMDGLTWANHEVDLYSWEGYGYEPEPLNVVFISASDPVPVYE